MPDESKQGSSSEVNDYARRDAEFMPLGGAMSFWEPSDTSKLTILTHYRFIHHLARGHVVIEGAAMRDGKHELGARVTPIPSDVFSRQFEFDPHGSELRAVNKVGQPITYRNLRIGLDHLEVLQSLMEDVKRQDLRQDLFARLADGKIIPEEAEAEAARCSIGPLNPTPDATEFDPLKEERWSFSQALAWIIWRDPDKVREYWPTWLDQQHHWRAECKSEQLPDGTRRTTHSYHLTPNAALVAPLDALSIDADPTPSCKCKMELQEAKTELFKALAGGKLDPDGVDLSSGRRVQIEKAEFRDLQLFGNYRGEHLGIGLGERLYDAPTLKRACVTQRWQPSNGDPESQCQEWLIGLMEKNPIRGEPTKPDYLAEAQAKFDGLIPAMFKRAWKAANSETGAQWDRGGRPKKNPAK